MGQIGIWQVVIIVIMIGVGLIPAIVAFRRRHKQKWLVLLVSFLTFIGWIIALIWAINGEAEEEAFTSSETFE